VTELPEDRVLADDARSSRLRWTASATVKAVRWWFGLTYLLTGLWGTVAAPMWVAGVNWGGLYLFGGGLMVGVAGWMIHPWGFQRYKTRKARVV
jgi:hypothetical protein